MTRTEEIRAREQKATPEPWYADGWAIFDDDLNEFVEIHDTDPDAIFIAHSREDIPFLLDDNERKDAEIVRLTVRVEALAAELVGYREAEQDKRLVVLPCKVGDTVWAIRSFHGVYKPQQGIVGDMFFTKDMKLIIGVANIARGEFGKRIFLTCEEAEAALSKEEAQ